MHCMCSLCPVGAAAATDGNRQIVPEKAYRDPGASAAGVKPSHTGEKNTGSYAYACYVSAIISVYRHLTVLTILPAALNAVFLLNFA